MDRARIHVINAVCWFLLLATTAFLLRRAPDELQFILLGGMLAATVVFYFGSDPDKGSDNVVLRSGPDFYDLGPGRIFLGICAVYYEVLSYNHAPRLLTRTVKLPTKDGSLLIATMGLSWQADPEHLFEYFTMEHEPRIDANAKHALQIWSKRHLPSEIYFGTPPELAPVPGVLLSAPTLTDIDSDDGDMADHIRDNTQLLTSIVAEVEDENRIESIRAKLKKDYPDRGERIDRLCNQRKWVLQKRGLGDNR